MPLACAVTLLAELTKRGEVTGMVVLCKIAVVRYNNMTKLLTLLITAHSNNSHKSSGSMDR